MANSDFKFLAIVVIFITTLSLIGTSIAIDDSITTDDITGTYNTSDFSENTNNFDVLKTQAGNMQTSNLMILSFIGTIVFILLVFVALRFVRGQ